MPLTETLSGFFDEEYNRFMGGLDRLTLNEQEISSKATRRSRENALAPRQVMIPAWDDVIHLMPRTPVTGEQRDEFYRARKSGRFADLPPDVIAEIERRSARIDAMQRSPQPDFDRAWGSVMTAMDNVQDFLSATAVFGRIALTVGAKIGLRAIPGLGQIILAADVLNLAMLLGQLAFPGFLALCGGGTRGVAAAAGTAVTAAAFKGTTSLLSRTAATSSRWLGPRAFSAKGVAGLIGAALVIGQTTDQLLGVGLSLGPLVGWTMGVAYRGELGVRGIPVEFVRSPSAEHFGPRIHPRLADVPTSALRDRVAAAEVWAQAALVLADDSPATDAERLLALAALAPAIGTLYKDWRGTGWQEDAPRLEGFRPPAPGRAADWLSWQDFLEAEAPTPPRAWPRSWGDDLYELSAAHHAVPLQVAAGIRRLEARDVTPSERAFVGALVNDVAEALWLLVLEDDEGLKRELTPGWLAAERMMALGVVPLPGNSLEHTQRWWDVALARVTNSRHAMMTEREWIELSEQFGIDVVLARPPQLI